MLSALRMASRGSALQLGIYLAAAQSLGAQSGSVWMMKPEEGGSASMDMGELPQAVAAMAQIARHLATGRYGALTPDKSPHSATGFVWPLACAPVPAAVLADKMAVTFGCGAEDSEGKADE